MTADLEALGLGLPARGREVHLQSVDDQGQPMGATACGLAIRPGRRIATSATKLNELCPRCRQRSRNLIAQVFGPAAAATTPPDDRPDPIIWTPPE